MRAFFLHPRNLILLFLTGISAGSSVRGETLLEVRFTDREVSFAGKLDSEETGQRLASAVRSVRPDLAIINEGLRISESEASLDVNDLENVLTELGLSTHEGRIAIETDSILIGGITDSLVTITALRIRLEPLMEGRRFINRICIVPSSDLPDIKVSLTSNTGEVELLDFEYHPSAEEMFEAPGLPPQKWFPTLVMLSDFDRLEGKKKAPLVAQPLVAMPIGGDAPIDTEQVFEALDKQDSTPQPRYEMIGSINFSRNAFLLQANQEPAIAGVSRALNSPAFKGMEIILKPVKASGGSGTYNEYLCEKRADEVKRLLSESGVMLTKVTTEISPTSSPVDNGEVRIVVKIPPPPPPPPEEEVKEVAEGEKVMVGKTTASEQAIAGDSKPGGEPDDKIPEHPLKRFRLKATTPTE